MRSVHASTITAQDAPTPSGVDIAPFVSQFVLGPAHIDIPEWRRLPIGAGLKLTAHPALACTQLHDSRGTLTLLGHALDPLAPQLGNEAVLRALLDRWASREALVAATASLGGRWLLIATRANDAFLFHDALGLRQAFYTDMRAIDELWVMSQPGLGTALALTPDPQALAYFDTETFRRTHEHRLPGSASTFLGLKHLAPNHWLDLTTGETRRYWPSAPLETIDLDTALDRLLVLMPGQIRAAEARHDLALALTAGVDSRLVLAAARGCVDRLRFVTVRQGRLPDGHPDVEIPARLLKRLGLAHDVIRAAPTMSPAFAWQFKRNVHLAHDHYGHDAEAILRHYGRTRAALTGSGAEVGRCPFRHAVPRADHIRLTPETLAWLEYRSTHPFLVAHFKEWLDSAAAQQHVKLLDLFEWEQDYGNWLAMVQLEFDVAWRDIFTPYNCRAVLATLLAVPARYRRPRDARLWRAYIERAWPALLDEPINPHKRIGRWQALRSDIGRVKNYWAFARRSRSVRTAHET